MRQLPSHLFDFPFGRLEMDTVASNASALVSAGSQAANASSDAIPVLPSVPALDNTYGAVLLGTFFGLM